MIRRARKRPRKHSVAWVTVWWVVWRTAVFNILTADVSASQFSSFRRFVALESRDRLARLVGTALATHSGRRFTP